MLRSANMTLSLSNSRIDLDLDLDLIAYLVFVHVICRLEFEGALESWCPAKNGDTVHLDLKSRLDSLNFFLSDWKLTVFSQLRAGLCRLGIYYKVVEVAVGMDRVASLVQVLVEGLASFSSDRVAEEHNMVVLTEGNHLFRLPYCCFQFLLYWT